MWLISTNLHQIIQEKGKKKQFWQNIWAKWESSIAGPSPLNMQVLDMTLPVP